MPKYFLRLLLVSGIILSVLLGPLLPGAVFAALERGPYLQSVSDSRVILRWRTTAAATGRVRYGLTQGNLNSMVDNNSSTTEHEIVITGLSANTRYYYSVGPIVGAVEAGADASHYFTTAPAVGSSRNIRIWAIGDPGTGDNNQRNVRDAYYNLDSVDTDVVLTLGDNAYNSGTDSEYTNNFFNVYQDLFKNVPVWATRGNHEMNQSVHETAFSHPKNGESGGMPSGSELYYSFDYGNIHFVCLDSFTSSNLNGDAMYSWLEADLASTTQQWIIAFWHHPPYSRSSSHDSDSEVGQKVTRERANPILEKYGVDLQLGGHNHFYSRTVLINNHYGLSNTYSAATHAIDSGNGRVDGDGIYDKASSLKGAVYVLAGSSGKKGYTPIHHPANFTEFVEFGSLVIDVEGDQLNVRMLRETGAIDDYFSITKASATNQAPTVNVGADQQVKVGASLNLDATVTDDGLPGAGLSYNWSKISGPGNVSFGNASAEDTSVSFTAVGSYVLRLEADDSALIGSDEMTVTVTPANQAPTVNAGADQQVEVGASLNLDATVSDDGLPGAGLSYSWSKISGPGTVSFGNTSAVDTSVSFSATGSYVLRLEADDSELIGSDDIAVTVTPANQAPSVNAGADQQVEVGAGLNLDATVTDDGLPGAGLSYSWSKVSGPGNVSFGSASAEDTSVSFTVAGSYVLRLEADDSELTGSDDIAVTVTPANQAPSVNAGIDRSTSVGATLNLDATVTDDGLPANNLTVFWSKVSGPGNVSFGDASMVDTSVNFSAAGSYVLRLLVSDTVLNSSDEMTVTVSAVTVNLPPQVDVGPDQQAEVGTDLHLNAMVLDDGLPGNSVTVSWSKISGPGNVIFADASASDTTVSFSVAGSYVLKLEASDTLLSDSDELTITVIAIIVNQPPSVSAGVDQKVTVSEVLNLNGAVSDDGLPSNSLSVSWSKVSGPGNVTFGNSTLEDTAVTFSAEGIYVLRLEATDTALTSSADVTITVEPVVANEVKKSGGLDFEMLLALAGLLFMRPLLRLRSTTQTG